MSPNQFKNLLVFMMIMTNEDAPRALMDKHPEYVLEKWYRYVNAPLPVGDGWRWGMHNGLKTVFDAYCAKWNVDAREWWPAQEELHRV